MRDYQVAALIALLALVAGFVVGVAVASAEYIPYGGGCVTTVVIQPDGKRLICTTCPQGNGVGITICQ